MLRDEGPRSRIRLSEETGLSPTTITKAVTPLIERGWLEEQPGTAANLRVGRPAIALRQVPEAISVCGVQIGVGVVRVGLADGWGRVRAVVTSEFDPSQEPEDVIGRIGRLLEELIAASGDSHPIAVGVAAPGAVDQGRRTNLLSINLGWREVPIADLLEESIGLPVIVDHNVRAMALAEARYGEHDADSMAYVYARTGVGLGLVLHGEPLFGGAHGVSELGHIRVVDRDGLLCSCGATGCLETVASEPYLRQSLLERGVAVPEGAEADVFLVLEQECGRAEVAQLRADVIDRLASALASVINLVSPDVIILGGALSEAPESLIGELRDAVQEAVFPLLRDEVRLERPSLVDAGVSAGAAVALEALVYADPPETR
jgi:predicted NBD/HSP70 family sugar kinase